MSLELGRLQNTHVSLTFMADHFAEIINRRSGSQRTWHWPAFSLDIGDTVVCGENCDAAGSEFTDEQAVFTYHHPATGLHIEVVYTLWEYGIRKELLVSGSDLQTPTRVIVERQPCVPEETVTTGFEALPSTQGEVGDQEGSEASFGTMPGCGYPVYVDDWFVGMEHAGAFTRLTDSEVLGYHHPVWQGGELASVPVVWGAAENERRVRELVDDANQRMK